MNGLRSPQTYPNHLRPIGSHRRRHRWRHSSGHPIPQVFHTGSIGYYGLIIGVTALAAATFSAIAHLLRTALGTTGSSLLLVLLILQLTAGGGTYPAALLPQFFQTISPFLPMTYLIDAFRILISGGLTAHLLRDVLVVVGCLVAALTATVAVVSRRKQLSMKDLHPPLISP